MANSTNSSQILESRPNWIVCRVQGPGETAFWRYAPSQAAAVVLLLEFLVLTIVILHSVFKSQTWDCSVFAVGGFSEIAGYLARAIANQRIDTPVSFIIQYGCIEVAPILCAISLHLILDRTVRHIRGQPCLRIPVERLAAIFLSGDLITLLLAIIATLFLTIDDKKYISGCVTLACRLAQLLLLLFFDFTTHVLREKTLKSTNLELVRPANWETDIGTITSVNTMIAVRTVIQIFWLGRSQTSYWATHEWVFYFGDALPMIFAMILFSATFPSPSDLELARGTSLVVLDKDQ